MEAYDILKKVSLGEISPEEAELFFKKKPYDDLGFAKLDVHRKMRTGFAEVIYCEGKSEDHLIKIYSKMIDSYGEAFGTRASVNQYNAVKIHIPNIIYDPISRILKYELPDKKRRGLIVVCTAGTADIPVAEEAAQTAEFLGSVVERMYDVGVSGIHRLLSKIECLQKANCIVTVAGMEGALASVIGGLVSCPVIGVPTSVGYGASLGGISALLTMINSCANGVSVVNIDNGFGAGFISSQINRLACK